MPDFALQLEMKSNTVLITFIDNAKMLFEAGRRRLLAGRKRCSANLLRCEEV